MTQQEKNQDKTATLIEIDGEAAARKSGSESSKKAMEEIREEMSRLSPQERVRIAKRVQQINSERVANDSTIPKAKVGYTQDGNDVAFIEFDPPTSQKVLESIALQMGASNPGGGRMRDTIVYQNEAERKRKEDENLNGNHGTAAAEKTLLKKLAEGGVNH